MKIGAKLPNSGPLALERSLPQMADELERAGFESLWVSDHIMMPRAIGSSYPFAADGKATWPGDTPYLDAMVALALAAASTRRVRLGTAVLVLGLRHPVVFAKQAASIDAASDGRLEIGVGVGWLREEFEALNVPYEDRGRRLDDWIAISRDCWRAETRGHRSERYDLPAGLCSSPTPRRPIPLLVGGHSTAALRRAGSLGDGWVAHASLSTLSPADLGSGVNAVRAAARDAGRDPARLRTIVRIIDSAGRNEEVASALPALEQAGVDEIVVDVDWEARDAGAAYGVLAGGRGSTG
jgi:probable F420-dependent oxidoreductase